MNEEVLGVLAWPAVVLILGLVGLGLFKVQLRQFIGRAQSIGKGWLVAANASQQSGVVQTPEALAFLNQFGGELLTLQEASIREDLSSQKLDAPGDVEKVLVRALATTQIALHFEQIHTIIWDGQIQLLETLNAAAPDGIEESLIAEVYDKEFRAKRPFYANIEFPVYLGWLFDKNLIRREIGHLQLTILGREFLKWMVENGKSKRGVG